ncbi:hypothetical protein TNCV_3672701 [Trichonephila clavipes]|nr:hypothetical protein TNCV_3672701 [Trichonephila clavipes]
MNNAALVPTSSEMRNIMKSMRRMPAKKKLSVQEALDLLQNLSSESSEALTEDSSYGKVSANNLLESSLDSKDDDQETEQE